MSGGQSPERGSANAEFNQPFSNEESVPIEVEPAERPSGAPVIFFSSMLGIDELSYTPFYLVHGIVTVRDMLQMGSAGEGEVSSQHHIEVAQEQQCNDVQWPRTPLISIEPLTSKRGNPPAITEQAGQNI